MAKCKKCGKELHFYNKAMGKYKGLCSGCAWKKGKIELKQKMKEIDKKSAKAKTEKEPKEKQKKKEEESDFPGLKRKKYPGEIESSIKKNFDNDSTLVGYKGGHPEVSKKMNGEFILTKKKLIFKGVIDTKDGHKYTKDEFSIPLNSIVDVQFKPKKAESGDVAEGILKEKYFGTLSLLITRSTEPLLLIAIKSKGMKIGIGFEFVFDEEAERWKNEIIKYRHKA